MTLPFSQRIAALILAASLLSAALFGCRASSSEEETVGSSLTSDSEPIETTAPDTITTPPVTTEPPITTPTDTTVPGDTTADTTELTETTVDTTEVIETTVPTVTEPLPDWPLYADNSILAEAITKAVDTYGAFAIQVAVIAKGQVVTTAEYGWQVHKSIPLSSESKIRVASLSKTIHALVVFRLIEEGKLSLDTDISEYLGVTVRNPYYPNTKITIRHILSHSSSLQVLGYVNSVQELRAQLRRESSYRDVKPGDPAGYAYNNYAFGVLGTICELVTGKNVSTLARQYFFDPMGIKAGWAPAALDRNTLTEIYDPNGLIGLSVDDLYGWVDGETPGTSMKNYAGGLLISAADYAKLLTLLMNDGCYNGVRYLSSSSVAQMKTAQFDRNEKTRQCLPVMSFKSLYGIRGLYYHTGSAYGVHNVYVFDVKSGLGVVVFTTGCPRVLDDRGLYAIGGILSDAVFKNRAVFEALAATR